MRGGLHVDSREALLAGGDSGLAVIAGAPDRSPLYTVLTYEGEYQMPPSGRLPEAVIRDFRAWIEMGAPDPRVSAAAEPEAPVRTEIDIEAGRDFWAVMVERYGLKLDIVSGRICWR